MQTIPAVFVIISSMLNNKSLITPTVGGSLIFSVLTAGFSSSAISYDLDTSEKQRTLNSAFYGYIRSRKRDRGLALFYLTLITCISLLSRCFALCLLFMVNVKLAVAFYFVEMALFFVWKAGRGELRYWVNIGGLFAWVISISQR